jgi:mutator protein MutT
MEHVTQKGVRVGVGVIIERDGKILVGKRLAEYAPSFSIPGGWVEQGETFEQAAIREIKEETGLDIVDPKVIAVTNNTSTFQKTGIHGVSVILLVHEVVGEPVLVEPHKCSEWLWCDPGQLPDPHFDASKKAVACYLSNTFY